VEICSYTHMQQNFAEMVAKALNGKKIIIGRPDSKTVIMISFEAYERLGKTRAATS
jgi:PHD/YefM family antitoxin component YafN of YafNO toxin-antitoxin module